MEYKFKNFNKRVKWQIDCDNTIKDKNNVILSSPTGSGKTGRYEYWALNKPERPIFITSPIKSLANQKFRDFSVLGYKVGLETGDIKYFPDDECDIICCTQEIYNNRYRDIENSTLIIDEFSYIFEDEERARAYIDSLYYSKAKNIMLCSATFGNPEEIKEYIIDLTGRNFYLYNNTDRLTTLEYEGVISKDEIENSFVVSYSKRDCERIAESIYSERLKKRMKILESIPLKNNDFKQPNKKIKTLVDKYDIDNDKLITYANLGVVFYYGSMYPKEKLFVEELFENKMVDTVVGTNALALGVNFPIQKVIFTDFIKRHKGEFTRIGKNLFEQLSGRAGRKGYYDKGIVYYCNDFSKTENFNEKYFNDLINEKNENVGISLNANIKDILLGDSSIENEVYIITRYSTTYKDYYAEKRKIEKDIEYIKKYDIAKYYIQAKYPKIDFSKGYASAIETCSSKTRMKIEELTLKLTGLQPFFNKDIGKVYMVEFSPKKNCKIFTDVLVGESLKKLIKKYGSTLYDILLLRKFLHSMPLKYSKNYDLEYLDNMIDELDYFILHPLEYGIKSTTNKNKYNNSIKCPSYFDKILINNQEYIKIMDTGTDILACYINESGVHLCYIPSNIKYKLIGLIKPTDGLKLLEKINISELNYKDYEIINTIEEIKSLLIKKYKS